MDERKTSRTRRGHGGGATVVWRVGWLAATLITPLTAYLVFRLARAPGMATLALAVALGATAVQFIAIQIAAEALHRARLRAGDWPVTLKERLWRDVARLAGRNPAAVEAQRAADEVLVTVQRQKESDRRTWARFVIVLAIVLLVLALVAVVLSKVL